MHTRVCGHCTVCRDERGLPRSEWHGGDFQWACFNATPQTSIPPSTYRASSFVVKNYFESPLYINRQHFTTAAALCLSTCLFSPLILYLYALNWPEAISAFLSHVVFFFTITLHQCRTKSLLSKWLEWMRGWSRYTGEEDNAGFSCARASFFTLYEMRWPICWMGREEGNSWFVLEMLFFPFLFFFSFFQITWLCPQTPRFPVDRGLIQCYFGCLLPPWISFFPQLSCPPPILSLVPPALSVLCSLSDCFQGAHSQGLEEGSSDVIHA